MERLRTMAQVRHLRCGMRDVVNPDHFVIYLLHFTPAIGRAKHYAGITKAERLDVRLREHCTGRGSRLTRKACQQGAQIDLVAVIPVNSPKQERDLKNAGHLSRRCHLCSARLTKSDKARTIRLPRTPNRIEKWTPLEWQRP